MSNVYLVRHPLLDRTLALYAYELLHSQDETTFRSSDNASVSASAAMILTSLLDSALDRIVKEHRAFLNVTPRILSEGLLEFLPAHQIVLQLSSCSIDALTCELMQGLRRRGFRISLSDFDRDKHDETLLETADFVSLNVSRTGRPALSRQLQLFKQVVPDCDCTISALAYRIRVLQRAWVRSI